MQPDFWRSRWSNGQIGFHQPVVESFLQLHWKALGLDPTVQTFVPLCGKSLDLVWLRDLGHDVVGAELSEIAVQAFFMEQGIAARRHRKSPFDRYESSRLSVLCGDFFDLTAESLVGVQAVYDRAALISWAPELRASYVRHMTDITAPGTHSLLIALEYPDEHVGGPPFSVHSQEIKRLYGPAHRVEEIARRDILATEPRMRAKGVTSLLEVCYHLVRSA